MDGSWMTTNSIYQQSSVTHHDFSPRYGWQSAQSNCNLNGNEREQESYMKVLCGDSSANGSAGKSQINSRHRGSNRGYYRKETTRLYPHFLDGQYEYFKNTKLIFPKSYFWMVHSSSLPAVKKTNYTRGNKLFFSTDVKISTASTTGIQLCWKNGRYKSSINPVNLLMWLLNFK